MSQQVKGTTQKLADSQCAQAYQNSLRCLDKNQYDKSKCKEEFEAYKQCKREEAEAKRRQPQEERTLPERNEQIKAKEVRVLFPDPEQASEVMQTKKALKVARQQQMDLVMVSPKAEPPVVRITEWSKVVYEAQKREKAAAKQLLAQRRAADPKEVRFSCQIGEHDLSVKMAQARKFLEEGNLLRLVVLFKGGQQIALGHEVTLYLVGQLSDLAKVKDEKHLQRPQRNQWAVMLEPLPPEKPAKTKDKVPAAAADAAIPAAGAAGEPLAAPPAELCDALGGPRKRCGTDATGEQECADLGCCWSFPAPLKLEPWQPDVYLPACFFANNGSSSYAAVNASSAEVAQGGFEGDTTLVQQVQSAMPEFGPDVQFLAVTLGQAAPDIARVKIRDANATAKRWEVPGQLFAAGSLLAGGRPEEGERTFAIEQTSDPFSFAVTRPPSSSSSSSTNSSAAATPGKATFNTTGLRLVFKDQYLEISTHLSSSAYVYGAGERASETARMTRNGYPYVLWTRDIAPTTAMVNSYGAWPFVMVLESDGTAWGALLLNSNGQEMAALPDRLTFRAVGGVIDLYVLMGPRPLDVMRQLTALVGRPALPPYWAFGFHQGRTGYQSLEELEAVVANYTAAGLPLESVWTDIDLLENSRPFTLDPVAWPPERLAQFVSNLTATGRHWVPVANPAIKIDISPPPGYAPYLDGLEKGVFVKGTNGDPYVGQTWAGGVHWPDFVFNPEADTYWRELLRSWPNGSEWSGLWLGMNEASNFCSGDICEMATPEALVNQRSEPITECQLLCLATLDAGLSPAQTRLVLPPYAIANGLTAEELNTKSLSVLASHAPINGSAVLEYNAHNLYGLTQAKATREAAIAIKGGSRRPFLVSRSTFLGSGAYAAMWTGGNNASFQGMQWSVPAVIGAGLAGIPMSGADVCGSTGNASEALCARWVALGAWYPLMRSFYGRNATEQELYRWPAVQEAAKAALDLRYRLLPYFYTLAQNASETGHPLLRVLWMDFPRETQTKTIDSQFMLGGSLLVNPKLDDNGTDVEAFFPTGLWFGLDNSTVVEVRGAGRKENFPAPANAAAPTYLLGGTIIPEQEPRLTTAEVKNTSITVVVGLPSLVNTTLPPPNPLPPPAPLPPPPPDQPGPSPPVVLITSPPPPPPTALVDAPPPPSPPNATAVPLPPPAPTPPAPAPPAVNTTNITVVNTTSWRVLNTTLGSSSGYMYNDDGSALEVRTSCCNFLGFRSSVIRSLNVTTSYSATLVNGTVVSNITTGQENTTWYNGQMVVQFGRTDEPANASQDCSSESLAAVEWPALRGMRIFGWTVPIETGWIKIGTFDNIPIPATQFEVQGSQLLINLDASQDTFITLKCPDPYTNGTFYWRSQVLGPVVAPT
ncbi:alpha-glucosidase isoform A [Chlorella sorokiniana]|uniref:Maltase n=1 Tax=Chlorella sorokiniana TaxID=3076 RepID=A0A2P6TN00_CHLSO|nr:alpha-glucosidase isoform A [Chlorella sorokiniana]|eukprot:PRW45700.1 alpha-glucosidase isoform A [Chlorella sorokiniana]